MEERRRQTRMRTYKGAKAAFGDFRFTYDCLVRNLSPDGAMVRSDHASDIPKDFYLYDPAAQALQQAEVIWRTERDLGVRFLGSPMDVRGSNDPRLARFRFL